MRPWLPFSLPVHERRTVLAALQEFVSGDYDLIWYYGLRPWVLAGTPSTVPVVLDIDDLEDQKIRARLSVPEPAPPSLPTRVRRWSAARFSEEEARRWRRLQDRAARAVGSVVVCSQLDADRLAPPRTTRVSVVPNGYPVVDPLSQHRRAGTPPVVLFQGTLRYPPNADAARFLVDEVGPALRALVPDARLRLVGLTTPALAGLDDPPDVTLVGQVPDLGVELAAADLVLVPIRFGSGTRVKIIEAFAHGVPVVSTTLGAEGLGAVDGEHLLLGDDPASLARACARLLTDEGLRTRIVAAAHDLFLTSLQRDRAVEAVRRGGPRGGRRMRILAVGENFPWPANGGGLIRLANSVEVLAGLGDVDLFTLCDPRRTDRVVPVGVELARMATTPYPEAARPLLWRASWVGRAGLPMEVAMRHFDPAPRASFEAWVRGPYDVVWFSTPATFAWLGRPDLGPTVVDLVDLEDEKERQRTTLLRGVGAPSGTGDRLRRSGAVVQSWLNARDWRGFQRSVSRQVDRVVLASPLDVDRSGLPNASLVPNALRRPEPPLGRVDVGPAPTILLQGSLNYAPNMDAAEWLVRDIAPRIRARVPGAGVRLVGRPTPGVERLDAPPSVTVVGRVADMDPELELADLVVVPVRYGSGTRVKILEAFAHRIPVVSTTIGAEGLDVTDGRHLLIADDPDSFADRCQRLLTDLDLRRQVADAAERLFVERYTFAAAQGRIRAVVHELGGSGSDR